MEQRLTDTQLKEIVAEVQHLSLRRESELDAEQVRDILKELNLPPEFLEEAMAQLGRRKALAIEQKRNRWIIGGVIAAIALVIIGFAAINQQKQQTLSRVSATQARIALTKDGSDSTKAIERQDNLQLFYRVTLSDAPVGQKLSMSCNWLAPNGDVMHQNRYETQEITKAVWDTTCQYKIPKNAPAGTWTVKAFVGDRLLSSTPFDLN
jgi:hypothetical protein